MTTNKLSATPVLAGRGKALSTPPTERNDASALTTGGKSKLESSFEEDLESRVRVAVRVRPMNEKEMKENCDTCVAVHKEERQVVIGSSRGFTYDFVFDQNSIQDHVTAECALPLVAGLFKGLNATLLAYGQTGSGKTYTMNGDPGKPLSSQTDDTVGIVPRIVKTIFEEMRSRAERAFVSGEMAPEFRVRCSYVELYNEEFRDLLVAPSSRDFQPPILIRETPSGEQTLVGVREEDVKSPEDVTSLIERGSAVRSSGATKMNQHSSRSHAVFTLSLTASFADVPAPSKSNEDDKGEGEGDKEEEGGEKGDDEQEKDGTASTPVNKTPPATSPSPTTQQKSGGSTRCLRAKIRLVDLAGSERAKKTGSTGLRFQEGVHINKGLLALGNVISVLGGGARRGGGGPGAAGGSGGRWRTFRSPSPSKDSLGGNSRTIMIACISPADANYSESLNTLMYADRARNIRNRPVVNEGGVGAEVRILREQLMKLQAEILKAKCACVCGLAFPSTSTENPPAPPTERENEEAQQHQAGGPSSSSTSSRPAGGTILREGEERPDETLVVNAGGEGSSSSSSSSSVSATNAYAGPRLDAGGVKGSSGACKCCDGWQKLADGLRESAREEWELERTELLAEIAELQEKNERMSDEVHLLLSSSSLRGSRASSSLPTGGGLSGQLVAHRIGGRRQRRKMRGGSSMSFRGDEKGDRESSLGLERSGGRGSTLTAGRKRERRRVADQKEKLVEESTASSFPVTDHAARRKGSFSMGRRQSLNGFEAKRKRSSVGVYKKGASVFVETNEEEEEDELVSDSISSDIISEKKGLEEDGRGWVSVSSSEDEGEGDNGEEEEEGRDFEEDEEEEDNAAPPTATGSCPADILSLRSEGEEEEEEGDEPAPPLDPSDADMAAAGRQDLRQPFTLSFRPPVRGTAAEKGETGEPVDPRAVLSTSYHAGMFGGMSSTAGMRRSACSLLPSVFSRTTSSRRPWRWRLREEKAPAVAGGVSVSRQRMSHSDDEGAHEGQTLRLRQIPSRLNSAAWGEGALGGLSRGHLNSSEGAHKHDEDRHGGIPRSSSRGPRRGGKQEESEAGGEKAGANAGAEEEAELMLSVLYAKKRFQNKQKLKNDSRMQKLEENHRRLREQLDREAGNRSKNYEKRKELRRKQDSMERDKMGKMMKILRLTEHIRTLKVRLDRLEHQAQQAHETAEADQDQSERQRPFTSLSIETSAATTVRRDAAVGDDNMSATQQLTEEFSLGTQTSSSAAACAMPKGVQANFRLKLPLLSAATAGSLAKEQSAYTQELKALEAELHQSQNQLRREHKAFAELQRASRLASEEKQRLSAACGRTRTELKHVQNSEKDAQQKLARERRLLARLSGECDRARKDRSDILNRMIEAQREAEIRRRQNVLLHRESRQQKLRIKAFSEENNNATRKLEVLQRHNNQHRHELNAKHRHLASTVKMKEKLETANTVLARKLKDREAKVHLLEEKLKERRLLEAARQQRARERQREREQKEKEEREREIEEEREKNREREREKRTPGPLLLGSNGNAVGGLSPSSLPPPRGGTQPSSLPVPKRHDFSDFSPFAPPSRHSHTLTSPRKTPAPVAHATPAGLPVSRLSNTLQTGHSRSQTDFLSPHSIQQPGSFPSSSAAKHSGGGAGPFFLGTSSSSRELRDYRGSPRTSPDNIPSRQSLPASVADGAKGGTKKKDSSAEPGCSSSSRHVAKAELAAFMASANIPPTGRQMTKSSSDLGGTIHQYQQESGGSRGEGRPLGLRQERQHARSEESGGEARGSREKEVEGKERRGEEKERSEQEEPEDEESELRATKLQGEILQLQEEIFNYSEDIFSLEERVRLEGEELEEEEEEDGEELEEEEEEEEGVSRDTFLSLPPRRSRGISDLREEGEGSFSFLKPGGAALTDSSSPAPSSSGSPDVSPQSRRSLLLLEGGSSPVQRGIPPPLPTLLAIHASNGGNLLVPPGASSISPTAAAAAAAATAPSAGSSSSWGAVGAAAAAGLPVAPRSPASSASSVASSHVRPPSFTPTLQRIEEEERAEGGEGRGMHGEMKNRLRVRQFHEDEEEEIEEEVSPSEEEWGGHTERDTAVSRRQQQQQRFRGGGEGGRGLQRMGRGEILGRASPSPPRRRRGGEAWEPFQENEFGRVDESPKALLKLSINPAGNNQSLSSQQCERASSSSTGDETTEVVVETPEIQLRNKNKEITILQMQLKCILQEMSLMRERMNSYGPMSGSRSCTALPPQYPPSSPPLPNAIQSAEGGRGEDREGSGASPRSPWPRGDGEGGWVYLPSPQLSAQQGSEGVCVDNEGKPGGKSVEKDKAERFFDTNRPDTYASTPDLHSSSSPSMQKHASSSSSSAAVLPSLPSERDRAPCHPPSTDAVCMKGSRGAERGEKSLGSRRNAGVLLSSQGGGGEMWKQREKEGKGSHSRSLGGAAGRAPRGVPPSMVAGGGGHPLPHVSSGSANNSMHTHYSLQTSFVHSEGGKRTTAEKGKGGGKRRGGEKGSHQKSASSFPSGQGGGAERKESGKRLGPRSVSPPSPSDLSGAAAGAVTHSWSLPDPDPPTAPMGGDRSPDAPPLTSREAIAALRDAGALPPPALAHQGRPTASSASSSGFPPSRANQLETLSLSLSLSPTSTEHAAADQDFADLAHKSAAASSSSSSQICRDPPCLQGGRTLQVQSPTGSSSSPSNSSRGFMGEMGPWSLSTALPPPQRERLEFSSSVVHGGGSVSEEGKGSSVGGAVAVAVERGSMSMQRFDKHTHAATAAASHRGTVGEEVIGPAQQEAANQRPEKEEGASAS
uniref:Kinesin motor domain-containing protein n=1 Tax=Chromera velia CCMP2878 TaxID=1169474 RepID=A0A0G4I5A3_9ALVE|eukprot:Cvel_1842.t1-p1 / transcript=Cvel_1842.t1 / gene=Cvel_1842 / organism=Chromera_velia_CCMP2878 / gene_product=Kinesin-like protein KIF27, putative / transcript_product=Kinesin-like protein KIF27, putative / location=Cvel_scaffold68:50033-64288(-) / protein_length=2801 / sequence_SO=supercontig / SO=protein_coding / is_pseudo=false